MSPFHLTLANIKYKPLTTLFHVLLMALGIATILTLIHLNDQIDRQFQKDLKGIDLVVSGKGSPLQIILSSVFHLDIPTGNISANEAGKLRENPLVKRAIPLALGDNYNGFRIVGTTPDYIAHYEGDFADGKIFSQEMEVVVGAKAASQYHVKVGDKIFGAHGLVSSDDLHTDFPYTVTGILKPNGTVLDRLVLTPLETVWHVHEHAEEEGNEGKNEEEHEEIGHEDEHHENEITALLISYKSPLAAATLPRLINESSAMQAASPAFEMARLNYLMNSGSDLIHAFGILMVGFAAFGVFITLYNAVDERRYDIALLRVMGGTRVQILKLMLTETLLLGGAGVITGYLITQIFVRLAAYWIETTKHMALEPSGFGGTDLAAGAIMIILALLAGLIPSLRAGRLNIAETLLRA